MSGFNKREISIDLHSEDDDFDNDEPPEISQIGLEYNKEIEKLTQQNTFKFQHTHHSCYQKPRSGLRPFQD